jgi:hypothetical protein
MSAVEGLCGLNFHRVGLIFNPGLSLIGEFDLVFVDAVFAAEVLHLFDGDVEEGGSGRLAAGAAQGSEEISDLDACELVFEVEAFGGDKDLVVACGAFVENLFGEMLHGDGVAVDHEGEALNEVFELADVAGPCAGFEHLEGFGGEAFGRQIASGAVLGEVVVEQEGDVAFAVAEWRECDGDDTDAVEEVFAELALVDHLLKVVVGGSNEAEVDLARTLGADTLDGLFLEDAEQLALEEEWERADLVEEEGAAVGEFNLPGMGGVGSGEGTFFVAEELGLHEGFGEGSAVDADEGLVAAWAEVDDGACGELFAGAALSAEEDGAVAGGHPAEGFVEALHRLAAADHVAEGVALGELAAEVHGFEVPAVLLTGFEEMIAEFGEADRG